ncbi:hypothetical protein [Streptomyces cyaneofuscatus]|uniref:hypothetical protein n=1 Tax=Streptomyces cyaneofuscatus TaxID=66883 RepID=UPI003803098A
MRIVSPYDREARRAICGNTGWSGYLVHVTETCETGPQANLITDIATTGPTRGTEALPGIHIRFRDRGLLPRQHLLDGDYLSVSLLHRSLRDHQVELVGPVKASGAWQSKEQTGFTRDDFTIEFDQRQVICPNGETSHIWLEPPAMAPYTVARYRPYSATRAPTGPPAPAAPPPAP